MKKLIILMLIFLVGKFSFGQYPINQSIGSDSTLVTSKGGLKGRIVVYSYADTAAANLERIRQYAGAMIYTTGVEKLYYRNTAASAWVELGSSAGGVNIYNSDGTIDGPRNINGGAFDISWGNFGDWSSSVGAFTVSQGATSAFSMEGDTSFFSRRVSYATNLGSTFTRHTLVDKNYVDSVNSIGGGGWNILGNAGSSSSTNFVGTTDNQNLSFRTNNTLRSRIFRDSIYYYDNGGVARLKLYSNGLLNSQGDVAGISFVNVEGYEHSIQTGDDYLEVYGPWYVRNNVPGNIPLFVQSAANQQFSVAQFQHNNEFILDIGIDSISFRPPAGNMWVDSLRTTSDTSVYKPLVWSPDNKSVRKFNYWPGGSGGSSQALIDTAAAIRADFPNTYADLTTSIVDEDGFYNGFPWPVQKGDTTIVFLKHSTTHSDTGSMRYYKSWNGGREWTTGTNVTVNGSRISISSLQTGIFNNRITICYTEDTYDSVKFAYSDNGGTSFYSAGALPYQVSWTGSPSIQTMFNIVSDTIYSAQYELDADSSRAFLIYSADNGVSWVRGNTVLLQPGGGFPNGRTSEWACIITELGTMDANTKLGSLHRNEDYGYYTFVSTANGFQTSTEDVTNFMYEFGNQVDKAPVNIYNTEQMIYIVCGNRRVNGLYALEYVTIPAASFYTNTQSAYSKVRKLYAATAATKAASIDFGYPVFYTYNQKPYVTLYDVSPVYHSSGEGGDDDVRSINFPLLDRGYSEKFNDANQSITDSTQTLVSYPDLLLDCMGSWDYDGDAGTTDSVWEAKEDGWYMVNAIATFEANGTGSYRQMYVIVVDPGVNTTATNQMISKTTIPGNSSISDFNRVECNGMAYIKQGEQVKVYVKHDATSALNLLNTSRETMATVKITLIR